MNGDDVDYQVSLDGKVRYVGNPFLLSTLGKRAPDWRRCVQPEHRTDARQSHLRFDSGKRATSGLRDLRNTVQKTQVCLVVERKW